jgi:hypothetical protein
MEGREMRMRCALCGKPTEPYAFIGAMAVGPKCAKKAGFTPAKIRKGALIRFTMPKKREAGPETIDLFDQLESHDSQRTTT